jgi:hypothetical protein
VVAYGSRSYNGAESRYSGFEGELLAGVYFVRLWRQYLYGERFVLESDHQPLKWILTNTKLTGKLAHWALMLSEFDFEVVHKHGVDNEMDYLSRFPTDSSLDCTGVRQEGELEGGCVWSAAACLPWALMQAAAQPGAGYGGRAEGDSAGRALDDQAGVPETGGEAPAGRGAAVGQPAEGARGLGSERAGRLMRGRTWRCWRCCRGKTTHQGAGGRSGTGCSTGPASIGGRMGVCCNSWQRGAPGWSPGWQRGARWYGTFMYGRGISASERRCPCFSRTTGGLGWPVMWPTKCDGVGRATG